ncbi:hypothetical protein [Sphingomonas ginsenosidivorax]|uniref:hypothetical protein n=1 Tax=Sphingomonas ginsenosidivorax TaxID=862135 RepID=UPI0013159FF3|nr:hypothetical protein [Sphingomonas ginsenosidivorax]
MDTIRDDADLRAILTQALTLADSLGHRMTAIRIAEAIDQTDLADRRSAER